MLFKGLISRLEANKDYCLCTKELVNRVEDMLGHKEIKRDKPCLYTLQRLSAAKQVNNFAITMLKDINCVLSQMIDDTRNPDLIRYNNIVEAKLSEYEKLLDKYIEYKGIDVFYIMQKYTDELLLYGEDCYKLSNEIMLKTCETIKNDNILYNCSRSTLLTYVTLMDDEYNWLVNKYHKYVTKSNEALHNFAELLNKEAV